MWNVNIYVQQDNADRKAAGRHYIYLMECIPKSGKIHRRGGFGEHAGTYHQTSLAAVSKALERLNQSCEIQIYLDDGFICSMFHSRLDEWAGNGWRTGKGERIANPEEWKTLWRLTKGQLVRMVPGKHKYSEILLQKMQGGKEQCMKYLEILTVQRN